MGLHPQGEEMAETHAILADHHYPFQDEAALSVAHKVVKAAKPDVIHLLGDVIDFAPISRFRDSERYEHTVQDELDEVVAYLQRLRRQFPDALIRYYIANHERRLKYFLWGNASKLKGLRAARFEHQFRFDCKDRPIELGIEFIHNKRLLAPKFVLKHGSRSNLYATRWEAEDEGRSGCSAHMHRTGTWAWSTPGGGLRVWNAVGCLCKLNPLYKEDDGKPSPWNHGLGILTKDGSTVGVENIVIERGAAIWRGRRYEA